MSQSGIDGSIDVEFDGKIAVVRLKRGENRLNFDFFDKIHEALDKVESNGNVECMLLTGSGKYFSIGVDLQWVQATPEAQASMSERFTAMLYRILTMPIITVAVLNGHAYAGGAFLALVCDLRVMNSERGWFCLNEARISVPFGAEFLYKLMNLSLPNPSVVRQAALLANRYTGREALHAGIVDKLYPPAQLLTQAKQYAHTFLDQGLITREIMKIHKEKLYAELKDCSRERRGLSKL